MARPVAVPLTVSLLLHLSVLVMLALNFTFSAEPKVLPPQPKIIEAKLISMEQMPAAKAQPKPVEAPPQLAPEPVKPVEAPKPEPSKPEPIKPAPEPPKPDLEKQKQIEKQKQLVEKQKQLEKEKADAARLAEQKKQEAERKRKEAEEAQRKQQQDDQARKLRAQQEKNELAKAMAAEDNAIAAERDQEAVASYAGLVQRDIQSNWSRPPSARIGMRVTLLIQLMPSGDVINVSVLKSSGNDAFDQSAQNAVRRVGRFPYLKELADKSPAAFEKNFRRLQLDFTPEDLRQ